MRPGFARRALRHRSFVAGAALVTDRKSVV